MKKYLVGVLAAGLSVLGILLKSGRLYLNIGNCTPACPGGQSCSDVIITCDRNIGDYLLLIGTLLLAVNILFDWCRNRKE